MTHLILTSVPLEEIPEPDRTSFVKAVENWGRNQASSETNAPVVLTHEVKDCKGRKCLEWTRVYKRILGRPKPIGHCDLLSYASATTSWFTYVRRVAVGTDIAFRKNRMTRYDVYDGELDCRIIEERMGGLNCLSLYLAKKAKSVLEWQMRLGLLEDRMIPFLETAAIYHLADQAVKIALGKDTGIDRMVAVLKKLERIKRICDLEEFDPQVKRQEEDE